MVGAAPPRKSRETPPSMKGSSFRFELVSSKWYVGLTDATPVVIA
jgi:hypothetical protein